MKRILLSALLLVLACGGDATGPAVDVTGTYTLQTLNGNRAPFLLEQSGGVSSYLDGATIRFNADLTYSETTMYRTVTGTSITARTDTADGTYTVEGSTLYLRESEESLRMKWTVSGNTLRFSSLGLTLIYSK